MAFLRPQSAVQVLYVDAINKRNWTNNHQQTISVIKNEKSPYQSANFTWVGYFTRGAGGVRRVPYWTSFKIHLYKVWLTFLQHCDRVLLVTVVFMVCSILYNEQRHAKLKKQWEIIFVADNASLRYGGVRNVSVVIREFTFEGSRCFFPGFV